VTAASQDWTPKLLTALRAGYTGDDFRADAIAGLTVAIVALPLAMALGIASGTTPEKGIVTAIVAGFLISALGGSRVQIGGPTGAFVVVVAGIIATHGYDGLVLATLMGGFILLLAGVLRLGNLMRHVPPPVIIGFTAGIAVIIATSQLKDFLGLTIPHMPGGVVGQWRAIAGAIGTIDVPTLLVASATLGLILAMRRWTPKLPAFLIAIVLAAATVALLHLPVATIGLRFPALNTSFPAPVLPAITGARLAELLPSALTIAFLAGIESLLSAAVADGMTGFRHRSNLELLAQGAGSIGSALFGGMPATGAIARTATNIRSGGRTPVAGMIHALLLLVFLLVAGDLMRLAPMPALAAVLLLVAWGMSESQHFVKLHAMPRADAALLLLTFVLTIAVDLTVAIVCGVTLALLLRRLRPQVPA
jgi:SulP family sulfate permease